MKDSVYLTFDDGPHPEVTGKVLQILKNYSVRATFFCVGDNLRKHPGTYQEVLAHGHQTGNHTFHHLNGWKVRTREYMKDVALCSEYVSGNLFRPPYGRLTLRQMMQLRKQYRIIMWTVLSGDFDKHLDPDQCLDNALNIKGKGDIVIFHDSLKAQKNMLNALPLFIEECLNRGYTFRLL